MVIPKFARQNGITVHLYVLSSVAIASLALPLTISHTTHALLPISQVPVVGQPVADLVNGAKDGIVKPTVQSVTNLLPQPVGNAVQAPVNALARTIDPIVGPSSQAASNRQVSQRQRNAAAPSITTNSSPTEGQARQSTQQAATDTNESNDYPKLSKNVEPVDKHMPVLGVTTKSFATAKDPSTIIAAGSVLLAMTLLFVSLIARIIRSHIRFVSSGGEYVLAQRDITLASAIVTGFIVIGSLLLYAILS